MINATTGLIARYSILAMPLAALGLPFYIYAPKWLAEDMGYGYTVVGMLMLLARFSDILTDIPVGIWSQPAGRQRKSMLIGVTLIAVSAYCLLGLPHPLPSFFLAFVLMTIFFGWTLVAIPWMALPVRLARSGQERLQFNTAREVTLLVATLFALVTPSMLDMRGVEVACIALIVVLYLFVLLQPCKTVPGAIIKRNPEESEPATIDSLELLENRKVRQLIVPWFLNTLANTLPGTVLILFARDVLGDTDLVGLALGVYFLSAIVGAPFVYWLARYVEPKKLWFGAVAWVAITYPILGFVGAGDGDIFLMVSVCTGFVLAADQVIPSTMQTALAQEISTQNNGAEVNTRMFALWSLLTKAAMGIGVGVGFIWLGANVQAATPSPSSVVAAYVWVPVLLKLIALPFIWRLRTNND